MNLYKAPRGTIDILPAEQPYWRHIESRAQALCELYGYQRIDTPVFEDYHLFARSIGEGTDIVSKEMYVFKDRGGNELTLRPEGTAPVCRAYLEHGLDNLPQPVKLYYIASIFRYERPQAGRYRQHWQFGFEAIGEGDPALDAELIDMAERFYTTLGLTRVHFKLNSIGCRKCRPAYINSLKEYYSRHMPNSCPDCQRRFQTNPLRLLDCKNPSCLAVAEEAPKSLDHLCPECQWHFQKVQQYLRALELSYNLDHKLVRGLDYYTRTVFEVQPVGKTGAQTALGGGGRYDNLIEELGGKPTPAVGFAAGINRIVNALSAHGLPGLAVTHPQVFIAYLGEAAKEETIKLAAGLRRKDIAVFTASGDRSLKAQMRQANSLNIRYVVIIGEDEVKIRAAILRDMTTGTQDKLPADRLAEVLAPIASTQAASSGQM